MTFKRIFIAGIIFFIVTFGISWWWGSQNFNVDLLTLSDLNKSNTSFTQNNKYEIALIYIGSSTCGFCNLESVQKAFSKIRLNLKGKIDTYGYKFTIIGISKDKIVTEGLIHLTKYGTFDEIMTGNGWSNNGILKYVYGKLPGKAATPQMLVTFRKYSTINTGNQNSAYRGIDTEKLLIRKIGAREIRAWANNNAYIPGESLSPF